MCGKQTTKKVPNNPYFVELSLRQTERAQKCLPVSQNQSSLYLHPQTQHSMQPNSNSSSAKLKQHSHSASKPPRHQPVPLRPKYQALKIQLTCQLSSTKYWTWFTVLWDMGNILYNLQKPHQAKNSQHLL